MTVNKASLLSEQATWLQSICDYASTYTIHVDPQSQQIRTFRNRSAASGSNTAMTTGSSSRVQSALRLTAALEFSACQLEKVWRQRTNIPVGLRTSKLSQQVRYVVLFLDSFSKSYDEFPVVHNRFTTRLSLSLIHWKSNAIWLTIYPDALYWRGI